MSAGISKEDVVSLLKKLCEAVGPSGYEEGVRELVVDYLRSTADKLWVDAWGNVVAVKKGSIGGRKLMLAAHIDEIGLFISFIDDNGFLRALPIGGITERATVFQRVLIRTRDGGVYRGVVGLRPPHIAKPEESQKIPEFRELFIDVGAGSRDEVTKMGIRVGDIAVFDRELIALNNDRVSGKAFDDRSGVAALIKAFELIENPEADVYAVATVQEEVGLKGARTSAFAISPDAAIALDVTIASDVPDTPQHEWCTRLGKGPAIKVADGRGASGLIAHPGIVNKLIAVAEEHKIPYQIELLAGGTTDASIIALNKEGVPAGTISIPTRYIHSPVEVLDVNDIINAVKLSKAFVEKAGVEWLASLRGATIK